MPFQTFSCCSELAENGIDDVEMIVWDWGSACDSSSKLEAVVISAG